jgi:hypothetical protein
MNRRTLILVVAIAAVAWWLTRHPRPIPSYPGGEGE